MRRWIWVLVVFGGLFLGGLYAVSQHNAPGNQKPVIKAAQSEVVKDGVIEMEKEYSRCGHTIITAYDREVDLRGKTLDEIRRLFSAQEGFRISINNGMLVIHETIDDWCPRDKERCRLKEYEGMLAVYRGPNAENDYLLRVTEIKISSLPANVQMAVRSGHYEFETEESLNDALENLDEFL